MGRSILPRVDLGSHGVGGIRCWKKGGVVFSE